MMALPRGGHASSRCGLATGLVMASVAAGAMDWAAYRSRPVATADSSTNTSISRSRATPAAEGLGRALRRSVVKTLEKVGAAVTAAAAALNDEQQQQQQQQPQQEPSALQLSIVLPADTAAAASASAAGDGAAAGPTTPTAQEATLPRPSGDGGSSTQRAAAAPSSSSSSSGINSTTLTIRVGGRCSTHTRATRRHGHGRRHRPRSMRSSSHAGAVVVAGDVTWRDNAAFEVAMTDNPLFEAGSSSSVSSGGSSSSSSSSHAGVVVAAGDVSWRDNAAFEVAMVANPLFEASSVSSSSSSALPIKALGSSSSRSATLAAVWRPNPLFAGEEVGVGGLLAGDSSTSAALAGAEAAATSSVLEVAGVRWATNAAFEADGP